MRNPIVLSAFGRLMGRYLGGSGIPIFALTVWMKRRNYQRAPFGSLLAKTWKVKRYRCNNWSLRITTAYPRPIALPQLSRSETLEEAFKLALRMGST
jgi:hypothetical protein